jgi:hypothetical protein
MEKNTGRCEVVYQQTGRLASSGEWLMMAPFDTMMRRLIHTLAWVHELGEHNESRVNKRKNKVKLVMRS